MKLLILTLLAIATLRFGIAGMTPEVQRMEEVERQLADLDGDGQADLVLVHKLPTDDPDVGRLCLELTLSVSDSKLTNCKALVAQRGGMKAWHQYSFEPGKLTLTHNWGTPERATETEHYAWDKERRDFRLEQVSQMVYNSRRDDVPALSCVYQGRLLPRYAYLSQVDREQLYAVLPQPGVAKQACSQY